MVELLPSPEVQQMNTLPFDSSTTKQAAVSRSKPATEKQQTLAPKTEPVDPSTSPTKEKGNKEIITTRSIQQGNSKAEQKLSSRHDTKAEAVQISSMGQPRQVGYWHRNYSEKIRQLIEKNQQYPIMAMRSRQQGTVMVSFILNPNGDLIDCHISRSCGHRLLDRAALRAVQSIDRYPPFPESLGREQTTFVIPVTFRLNK